jgi:cyclic pyranopterin phosphate synthase
MRDTLERPLGSLRLSVTDRCNLRCLYCMPEDDYVWLPRQSILTFEELARLTAVFAHLGVHKVRLTGGEPLLRQDLPTLIALLQQNEQVTDLALTTNGILLASQATALAHAGLQRVTVSLDTLRPERFQALTRSARHADVLSGIAAAADAGLTPLKLNAVIMRGCNEDELIDLIEFGRRMNAEVRFIEYMDVGGATQWAAGRVFSRAEMLATIGAHYGAPTPRRSGPDATAPAEEFVLPDGTAFGIIASTTAPFCRSCDRSRITADGIWFLCLYAVGGTDLRQLLRQGASDTEIASVIENTWRARADRGAEERAELAVRGALYQIEGLRSDPHREMHTRGG